MSVCIVLSYCLFFFAAYADVKKFTEPDIARKIGKSAGLQQRTIISTAIENIVCGRRALTLAITCLKPSEHDGIRVMSARFPNPKTNAVIIDDSENIPTVSNIVTATIEIRYTLADVTLG